MLPTILEQYQIADRIISACCKVGNLDYTDFINRKKSLLINTLRGVYYVIAWEMKVHPKYAGELCKRTRSDVINVYKRYYSYLKTKDKLTTELYNKVKEELKNEQ